MRLPKILAVITILLLYISCGNDKAKQQEEEAFTKAVEEVESLAQEVENSIKEVDKDLKKVSEDLKELDSIIK